MISDMKQKSMEYLLIVSGALLNMVQSSILFLYDMFFLVDSVDIAGYTDNNSPCTIGKNKYELENKLQIASVNYLNGSMKRHESKQK